MTPIYTALKSELGLDEMLVAYSDDINLHGLPATVTAPISTTPTLYKKARLRIG